MLNQEQIGFWLNNVQLLLHKRLKKNKKIPPSNTSTVIKAAVKQCYE